MNPLDSETEIQDFVLLVFNLALIQPSPTISTFCFLFFLKFFSQTIHLNYSFPSSLLSVPSPVSFSSRSPPPPFPFLSEISQWYQPNMPYQVTCKPSCDRCGLCSVRLSGGLCASWGIRKCEEGMGTVWCGELWEWGCLQAGGLHGPFTGRVTFL